LRRKVIEKVTLHLFEKKAIGKVKHGGHSINGGFFEKMQALGRKIDWEG